MGTSIQNRSDLVAEQARLTNQLETSRAQIRQQLSGIKEEINPAKQAFKVATGLMARPQNALLHLGIGKGVDLALALTPIGRAVWPVRVLLPLVLKRATTNYLSQNRNEVLEKTLRWVRNVTEERPPKPKRTAKERFFRWVKRVTDDPAPASRVPL